MTVATMTPRPVDPFRHVHTSPEAVHGAEMVLATYYMQCDAGEDAWRRAAGLAIGQSIGTWTAVPGISEAMLERHAGRVVALHEAPPVELRPQVQPDGGVRSYFVQIAFPCVNFDAELPLLLTVLLGNDVSTSAQVKLLEVEVPPGFAAAAVGPRFGIAGIRNRLGGGERPLLLNVLKPNIGLDVANGAALFAEAARGGCDIVKDDELLGNTAFSGALARVEAFRRAAEQVFEETGHRALYCVNVTQRPDRLLETARRAVELGADMIMINAVASGLGVLQAAAADPAIDVPILAHYAGASAMAESPSAGIASPLLLGKLMRIAGADASSFNSPYSTYPLLREKYAETARRLRMPLHGMRPSLPVPGGGIHPATAASIVRDLGADVLLSVGGAIQGHPGGAASGARAMRQAMDAAFSGRPLTDAAREHPELAAAVRIWGAEA